MAKRSTPFSSGEPVVGRQAQASRSWFQRPALIAAAAAAMVVIVLIAWRIDARRGGQQGAVGPNQAIAQLVAPDVHSLLIDPTNPDHVLFGSHSGLQESTDGGSTWRAGTLRGSDAMSMASSAKDSATIYVAGHDVFEASRDGGKTWQPVRHTLPGSDIHAFAQDPKNPNRLFALLANAGVYVSSDEGATWSLLGAQPPGDGPVALADDGESLYAAMTSGIQRSRDGGTTWQALPAQPGGVVMSLAVIEGDAATLYAGMDQGLFKSVDGGQSWRALIEISQGVMAVAVAPSNPQRVLFVSSDARVFRSDDAGSAWLGAT